MSDFIKRLDILKEKKTKFVEEKNRLEASISIHEEAMNTLKQTLEDNGLSYDSLEELEQEIQEREQSLESKLSNLESMTNNSSETEQPNIESNTGSSDIDAFFEVDF